MAQSTASCVQRGLARSQFGIQTRLVMTLVWSVGISSVMASVTHAGHLSIPSSQTEQASERPIDFSTQILPILKRRCFECHAQTAIQGVKGDLSLDRLEGFRRGGHSGSQIVAATPEESELYLRVSSTSDGYRMPQQGPLLADGEIQLIRDWIQQGGSFGKWNGQANISNPSTAPSAPGAPVTLVEQVAELWNGVAEYWKLPRWRYSMLTLLSIFGVWLVGWLVTNFEFRSSRRESNKVANATDQPDSVSAGTVESASGPDPDASSSLQGWLPSFWQVTVIAVLLATIAFLLGQVVELGQENEKLRAGAGVTQPKAESEVIVSALHLPQPPYPMHPRRLGGVYYRGNDERSEQLFNGGFYRTATIELFLVDANGTRLAWHAPATKPMFVELTINRAANATTELFSERVRQATRLQHYPFDLSDPSSSTERSTVDHPTPIRFEVIQEDRQWRQRIPLQLVGEPVAANATADRPNRQLAKGMIYLCYGNQDYGHQTGRVHFGIRYDLRVIDGLISEQSELWMGSIYNLNGRVLVPGRGEVLLDRWFDFRPIPEIEGQPATDPELLGLPEHTTAKPGQ